MLYGMGVRVRRAHQMTTARPSTGRQGVRLQGQGQPLRESTARRSKAQQAGQGRAGPHTRARRGARPGGGHPRRGQAWSDHDRPADADGIAIERRVGNWLGPGRLSLTSVPAKPGDGPCWRHWHWGTGALAALGGWCGSKTRAQRGASAARRLTRGATAESTEASGADETRATNTRRNCVAALE